MGSREYLQSPIRRDPKQVQFSAQVQTAPNGLIRSTSIQDTYELFSKLPLESTWLWSGTVERQTSIADAIWQPRQMVLTEKDVLFAKPDSQNVVDRLPLINIIFVGQVSTSNKTSSFIVSEALVSDLTFIHRQVDIAQSSSVAARPAAEKRQKMLPPSKSWRGSVGNLFSQSASALTESASPQTANTSGGSDSFAFEIRMQADPPRPTARTPRPLAPASRAPLLTPRRHMTEPGGRRTGGGSGPTSAASPRPTNARPGSPPYRSARHRPGPSHGARAAFRMIRNIAYDTNWHPMATVANES
jgi:hypothetical protein